MFCILHLVKLLCVRVSDMQNSLASHKLISTTFKIKSRFLVLSVSLVTSSKLSLLRLWCSIAVRTLLLLKIKQVNLIQLRLIPANVYLTYPSLPQSSPHVSLHIIPANTTLLKHEVNVVCITESCWGLYLRELHFL